MGLVREPWGRSRWLEAPCFVQGQFWTRLRALGMGTQNVCRGSRARCPMAHRRVQGVGSDAWGSVLSLCGCSGMDKRDRDWRTLSAPPLLPSQSPPPFHTWGGHSGSGGPPSPWVELFPPLLGPALSTRAAPETSWHDRDSRICPRNLRPRPSRLWTLPPSPQASRVGKGLGWSFGPMACPAQVLASQTH